MSPESAAGHPRNCGPEKYEPAAAWVADRVREVLAAAAGGTPPGDLIPEKTPA